MSLDPRDPEFLVEPGPEWLTLRDLADELGLPESGPLGPAWAKLEAAAATESRPCLDAGPIAWAWLRSGSAPVFAVARSSVDTFRAELGLRSPRPSTGS